MPLQVVLPEEALLTEVALVAAHLAVATVHVGAHVRPVEEPLVADAAVELVRADVQPLVLHVPGVREEVLAADLARLARREARLAAVGDVVDVRLVVADDLAADAGERFLVGYIQLLIQITFVLSPADRQVQRL